MVDWRDRLSMMSITEVASSSGELLPVSNSMLSPVSGIPSSLRHRSACLVAHTLTESGDNIIWPQSAQFSDASFITEHCLILSVRSSFVETEPKRRHARVISSHNRFFHCSCFVRPPHSTVSCTRSRLMNSVQLLTQYYMSRSAT